MSGQSHRDRVTAGMVVIGDEILSGRTRDRNIGTVAAFCSRRDIELCEVRVVRDGIDHIVDALNALRSTFTYVFTTGGIGPTHDDITVDAVASAFSVGLSVDKRAIKMMQDRFDHYPMNEGRLRMARIPHGAGLIENTVSGAPGIQMENVYVMAGVPEIVEAMLDAISPTLRSGVRQFTASCDSDVGESILSPRLAVLQKSFPTVRIGSYPQTGSDEYATQIVLRSADRDLLEQATRQVNEIVADAKNHDENK